MGKIKDLLFPELAGLDDIEKARIPAAKKLDLLRLWRSPYRTRQQLMALREQITTLEREAETES